MNEGRAIPSAGAGEAGAARGPVTEDPASLLGLLRGHLAEVRAAWADRVRHLTPPRGDIAGASRLFGRDREAGELLALVFGHRRVALTGAGGLGKTALSHELVARMEAEPWGRNLLRGGLFTHDFYQKPSLADFVSGILEQAGLACEQPPHQPALAALVLRAPGVALYLEGAEKLENVDALLEFLGAETTLILTTRDPRQAGGMAEYPLEPLEFADAAAAIHYYASGKPRKRGAGPWPHGPELPGWEVLARDLGGHALACRIAGELCALYTRDPAELHGKLLAQGLEPILEGKDSKRNLHLLFRQSALAVREVSPGEPSPALTAWHCLILGGTSPVPLSLLTAFGMAAEEDLRPLLELGLAWSTQVAAEERGETEPAFALSHALLAEWARTGLAEFGRAPEVLLEPAMRWGEEYQELLLHLERIPGGPERYPVVVPAAEALLREVEDVPDLEPMVYGVFFALPARLHDLSARYLAAEGIYRRALAFIERTAGAGHTATSTVLNNLALLLKTTNRAGEAELLMRRALAIYEASYGKEHPKVAISLNNLAQLLQATNRLGEAEPLMRLALAIDEASHGKDHHAVAIRLNNLASLLQATNRLGEAEQLMRRALAIGKASHGEDHPQVATQLNNLAQLLKATKRLGEAEPLMRRALIIDEASYGKEHPKVAIRFNNLAQLLKDTNRLGEAEPLMRRALAIDEAAYGKEHPRVATDLSNLASLLQDTNQLGEAEPLIRRALAIDETSYGKEHPVVAIRLNNLARVLLATNRLEEAEPLMRRHLKIFVAFTFATGHPHPHLTTGANNYARLLVAMGDPKELAMEKARALLAPVKEILARGNG